MREKDAKETINVHFSLEILSKTKDMTRRKMLNVIGGDLYGYGFGRMVKTG